MAWHAIGEEHDRAWQTDWLEVLEAKESDDIETHGSREQ